MAGLISGIPYCPTSLTASAGRSLGPAPRLPHGVEYLEPPRESIDCTLKGTRPVRVQTMNVCAGLRFCLAPNGKWIVNDQPTQNVELKD
jgi:hypothetical protein